MTKFDLSVKNHGYYAYERKEMLPYVPESAKRVLDVGCGAGFFGHEVKRIRGAEVWGVEIDETAAATAVENLDRVLVGDIHLLMSSIPDDYFDCVTFNDVLEHLVDPYGVLRRVKGKLRKGGVIVASLPNIRYHKVLKELLIRKQWQYRDEGILDKTHLRFFTKNSIIDMFRDLDFRILALEGMNKTRSRNFKLLNMVLFGFLSDAQYAKFTCVAEPK